MDRLHHESVRIPQYLYRVQFPGCNTTWTDEGIFATENISILSRDYLSDYLRSIEEHFLREERLPIPYISLFSHREHAEIWALKLPGNPDIRVLQISTRKLITRRSRSSLSHTYTRPQILPLPSLLQKFHLPVSSPNSIKHHSIDSAYLIPHHVPARAIVDVRNRAQIEIGAFDTFFNYVCQDIGSGEEDSTARSFLYSILARAEISTSVGEAIELLACQKDYEKVLGEGSKGGIGEF